jgi:glycosyltransferase involved in cell wall biosynthesis
MILAIILTFNEEIHIKRCIENCKNFADRIIIIDSLSTDKTKDLCLALGCEVFERNFTTHAEQFNWLLSKINAKNSDWIVRLDADEYFDSEAIQCIRNLDLKKSEILGYKVNRKISFKNKVLNYGGFQRNYILRIFRYGYGRSNDRVMDEHIIVRGATALMSGNIIDDCQKGLDFWILKHVRYANREVEAVRSERLNKSEKSLKKKIFDTIPMSIRAILYFLYRYFLLRGFRDGLPGLQYALLQALWYRTLVDALILEADNE